MGLYLFAGMFTKTEDWVKKYYIQSFPISATDETTAEIYGLKKLKEYNSKKDGYAEHQGYTVEVRPEFYLLARNVVDKDWKQKVEWAKKELLENLTNGKFDDKLSYVLGVIAEDRYNAGRDSMKKA